MKSSAATVSLRLETAKPGYWAEILLSRALPATFFSLFLADKLVFAAAAAFALLHAGHNARPSTYMYLVNQVLAVAYFTLLVVLFATRRNRVGGRRSVTTFAVSFFGTFSVLLAGVLPAAPTRTWLLLASDLVLAGGLAYSVWALAYLRRSFSLLPEARHLVTTGPYGITRHPLYLGETAACVGAMLPTIGGPGILLVATFLAAQYIRMGWEEEVLAAHFAAQYAAYRRRVPKYLPDPRRLFRA